MPLTDIAIKHVKPGSKTVRLFDGGGLYLEVSPAGGKWWRFKYRFGGKEKRISLGVYPDISLKDARTRHLEARRQVAQGIDPSEIKKMVNASLSGKDSFETVAREWVAFKSPGWSPSHRDKTLSILEKDIFPYIGARPIGELKPAELLAVLKRIDIRSSATARKAYSACKQVFVHDIPSGRVTVSPAEGLYAHLSPRIVKHMASPTTQGETARLLIAIDGYAGTFVVHCAMRLQPLLRR